MGKTGDQRAVSGFIPPQTPADAALALHSSGYIGQAGKTATHKQEDTSMKRLLAKLGWWLVRRYDRGELARREIVLGAMRTMRAQGWQVK